MTDKQEVEAEVETEEPKEEAEPTKSQDRKYSDADVNRLIAKEKAAWKRSADKEKSTLSEAETSLREQLTSRDEIIQKNVDLLKRDMDIDEEDWELTMADRDVLFQYDYLLKKADKASKLDIPRTPRSEGGNQKATFARRNRV